MADKKPTWLNEALFEKVLRKVENNELIKVSNVNVKPAVGNADNYMSDMFRVRITYSRDQKGEEIAETSHIVKIIPYGDFREDLLKEGEFFATEISMLSITLPRMNKLLDEIGITALSAQCYHVQREPPTYLVVEDLKEKSFQMAERHAGLDLDHCWVTLRKLAAFHASSVALREKDSEAVTKYWRGIVHEDQPASWAAYFNATTKHLGQEVAKWPGLSPRISEKIIKLSEVTFQKAAKAALFKETDFNVLNHSDVWSNNMMYIYDNEGKPTDVIFVDFQLNRYGSPAIDLLYFLGSSPCDNVREHKREFILREYHATLCSTMAKLKCTTKPPTFDELEQMLKERAFYEVMSTFCVMPIVLVEKKDGKTLAEQMQPDGTCDNPGYRSKEYIKVLTRLLPLYDSLGLLDV